MQSGDREGDGARIKPKRRFDDVFQLLQVSNLGVSQSVNSGDDFILDANQLRQALVDKRQLRIVHLIGIEQFIDDFWKIVDNELDDLIHVYVFDAAGKIRIVG